MWSGRKITTKLRWHKKHHKTLLRYFWQGENTDTCNLEGNCAHEVSFTFVYWSSVNDRNQSTILNLTSQVWIPPVLLWQNRSRAEWVYVLTTILHKMHCTIPDRYWVEHQYITTCKWAEELTVFSCCQGLPLKTPMGETSTITTDPTRQAGLCFV